MSLSDRLQAGAPQREERVGGGIPTRRRPAGTARIGLILPDESDTSATPVQAEGSDQAATSRRR